MKKLTDIRLPVDQESTLHAVVAALLNIPPARLAAVKVLKRSLDARKKPRLFYVYTVEAYLAGETVPEREAALPRRSLPGPRPVIIGAGPGGLFAALRLLDHGIPSILFERGAEVHPRTVRINMFWKRGILDPESNVCFGEGGAGLFSDGKLITRIKSPHIQYVLRRLVDFGAPPEIAFVHNPHVGSDKLRKVIRLMVQYLREQGCELHYETRVDRLLLGSSRRIEGVALHDGRQVETGRVVLATGHSARDFYRTLHAQGVYLEPKSYAVGLRVEHPQALIDRIQLGDAAPEALGAAQYKLTYHHDGVSVYSFCMCPGGYVLSSGTEPDGVVVNGMSNYHRNSRWANSALVVPVAVEDFPGEDPFRMQHFQRELEHRAWQAVIDAGGTKQLPAQRLTDFLVGRRSRDLPAVSSPSGAVPVNLVDVLPERIISSLYEGLQQFQRRMPGFISPDAVVMGVESRTSSPLRILRDPATLQSVNTPGLYPVGEGAGYAGGITSAAVDGIRAVSAMLGEEIG
jgi:hypothetical protein